ncbi:MAG: C40 family peptidase [Muribaculaceae bacterium]|nr:C40 family peptidase [Muribaculaceae bacterium]
MTACLLLAIFPLSTINADPIPEHTKSSPAKVLKQAAQASERSFADSAFENARLNSPFASFNAQEEETSEASPLASKILDYATKYLGTRYRSGAAGPKAFDCSGFTSYVFRNAGGIELQRSSRDQYTQGEKVSVSSLRPGDLLFFSSRSSGKGRVGHVAIVASVDPENNTCRFIHASTKHGVTYNNFPDNGYYSRNFIGAKRVIDED